MLLRNILVCIIWYAFFLKQIGLYTLFFETHTGLVNSVYKIRCNIVYKKYRIDQSNMRFKK